MKANLFIINDVINYLHSIDVKELKIEFSHGNNAILLQFKIHDVHMNPYLYLEDTLDEFKKRISFQYRQSLEDRIRYNDLDNEMIRKRLIGL